MPIPLQTEMFRLVLDKYADERNYSRREMKDKILPSLNLTDDEKKQKTSSGVPVYESRVGWAVTHLHKATYLQRVNHGTYRITEEGKTALANQSSNVDFLMITNSTFGFLARERNQIRQGTQYWYVAKKVS